MILSTTNKCQLQCYSVLHVCEGDETAILPYLKKSTLTLLSCRNSTYDVLVKIKILIVIENQLK